MLLYMAVRNVRISWDALHKKLIHYQDLLSRNEYGKFFRFFIAASFELGHVIIKPVDISNISKQTCKMQNGVIVLLKLFSNPKTH